MQSNKPFVIVNPKAGSAGDIYFVLEQLRRLEPVELHLTSEGEDAETLARNAARSGYDYVVAAGGDGTINAVVNGIARSRRREKIRIGVLPLGTGNDFARSLGLPTSIEGNIDIMIAGETALVDLVRAKGRFTRYFVNVSAGGFSGVVDEMLTPEIKRSWGPLAYLRAAAEALPELEAYHTKIVCDDEHLSLDLYYVVIANGQFVAGGLPIAPQADLRDGMLDLILIPKLAAPSIALLIAQMMLGKHLEMVTTRRAKNVSVRSRPAMWFNVDGELFGNKPIVFQVIPGALTFVVAKK